MQQRDLGASGISASVVGLGAWGIGGGIWWGEGDDDQSIAAIHAAIAAGITLIDTAPIYGFGHSERLLGRALRDRRDQVILATKCGLWWEDDRGSVFVTIAGREVRRSLLPSTIALELEASLRRLQTDYVDLYQVHWPAIEPEKTPIAETLAALVALQRAGKIRAIGVSNVSLEEIAEYAAGGAIVSNQLRYSPLWRGAEADLLPWCQQQGLATLTYMSLEQGLLTGKVGIDRTFPAGSVRTKTDWNPWFAPANRQRVLDLLAGWADLTEQYACSLAQLVLAWTAAQPGVTYVLAGCRTPAQAQDNAGGGSLVLAAADVARMRADVEALGDPLP